MLNLACSLATPWMCLTRDPSRLLCAVIDERVLCQPAWRDCPSKPRCDHIEASGQSFRWREDCISVSQAKVVARAGGSKPSYLARLRCLFVAWVKPVCWSKGILLDSIHKHARHTRSHTCRAHQSLNMNTTRSDGNALVVPCIVSVSFTSVSIGWKTYSRSSVRIWNHCRKPWGRSNQYLLASLAWDARSREKRVNKALTSTSLPWAKGGGGCRRRWGASWRWGGGRTSRRLGGWRGGRTSGRSGDADGRCGSVHNTIEDTPSVGADINAW